jgi:hypothetical protein
MILRIGLFTLFLSGVGTFLTGIALLPQHLTNEEIIDPSTGMYYSITQQQTILNKKILTSVGLKLIFIAIGLLSLLGCILFYRWRANRSSPVSIMTDLSTPV